MSSWDKDLDDWFKGFFSGRIGLPMLGRGRGSWFGGDTPRQFDEMRRDMESMLEYQFRGNRIGSTKRFSKRIPNR